MATDTNPSGTAPRRVLMIAANPATSPTTGWPIGVWAAELTHPHWTFTEAGYEVEICSPEGGALLLDSYSDPRDASGYSAHDLISLGFLSSPAHAAKLQATQRLADVDLSRFDAVFVAGGQSPMVSFIDNTALHRTLAQVYEDGKVLALVCHGTCVLLKTVLSDGRLLVHGKTWTGFANSEEAYADSFIGMRIQPFWIEDEARKIAGTNFVVDQKFRAFAVRDGRLVTGQQQCSGAAAAALVIEALGR
ncbi:type 1 glutamine amidotransferase domain-containing protein [Pseudaquabacterium pictum]|uniref:Type 1 glutamine amidotransferase domain-containing protein n=1 Tax=Pseudaquabacterium pictum TaxID=2315236 RepID=A0A480AWD7_9BURK|nr:type 1 glutamine amidotransferase domain-containing protein [Rubrivivax pictus]GCL65206.1 type 1 glutamine amidotransferase domain-containing protein [Rubrivivax pictus]